MPRRLKELAAAARSNEEPRRSECAQAQDGDGDGDGDRDADADEDADADVPVMANKTNKRRERRRPGQKERRRPNTTQMQTQGKAGRQARQGHDGGAFPSLGCPTQCVIVF